MFNHFEDMKNRFLYPEEMPAKEAEFQVIDTKLHEGTPKEEKARQAYLNKNWKELASVPDNRITGNVDPSGIMEALAEDIQAETVEPEGIELEGVDLGEIENDLCAMEEKRTERERAILGELQFCDFNNGEPETRLWEMHLPEGGTAGGKKRSFEEWAKVNLSEAEKQEHKAENDLMQKLYEIKCPPSNSEAYQKQKEAYEMLKGEIPVKPEQRVNPLLQNHFIDYLQKTPEWLTNYNNPPGTEDKGETRAKRYFQEREGSE